MASTKSEDDGTGVGCVGVTGHAITELQKGRPIKPNKFGEERVRKLGIGKETKVSLGIGQEQSKVEKPWTEWHRWYSTFCINI